MAVKRSIEQENSGSRKVFVTDFFKASQNPKKRTTSAKPKVTSDANLKVESTVEITLTKPEHVVVTETLPEKNETTKQKQTAQEKPIDSEHTTDYIEYCKLLGFDKQKWVNGLTPEEKELLTDEISHIHISWLAVLYKELTKPYFLNLKRFLKSQAGKTIFPPRDQVYSWSKLTPLPEVKCLILGQDPYHNHNQAHGLAFSVLEPTRPPPSLLNIYKTLAIDFPEFKIPEYKELVKQGTPGGGNLTSWAKRGILMLNAVLTVEAHKANSHAKRGWEQFTEQVIKAAVDYHQSTGFVIMAWGSPAQSRVAKLNQNLSNFLVLKTVHPSPLSASRGFFVLEVFKKCNEWLQTQGKQKIDWGLFEGNVVM
jgi:uracil-DNA glycosylase